MIGNDINLILNMASREAYMRGHEFLSIEHLLFAMINHDAGERLIKACGGKPERLKARVENFFNTHIEKIKEHNENPRPTLALQRVLQITIMHVQSAGKKQAEIGDLLSAIMTEHESYAVYFLKQEGISRLDVLNYISHGINKANQNEAGLPLPDKAFPDSERQDTNGEQQGALETFTFNLTQKAALGSIDPLIGRGPELERTMQVLCRRRKNNPVFIGEPGVGKTALAEGLALKIYEGNVPETILGTEIYALDLGALLAGTKYRGEFEARLKDVIAELQKRPGAILFIDEIHTLVGAGATSGGSMDASNILKPALANGGLRCIGATTYEEYRNFFEKDRALSRRFQKIEIKEPSVAESIDIIKGLKPHYERHHGVRYTNKALKSAVELSARYITDRYLPDKAIDVMDEAAAALKLASGGKGAKLITARHIENTIAKMAMVPAKYISRGTRIRLTGFEASLKSLVFGQEGAIKLVSSAIKRSHAGLSHPDHPIGSFLFVGPTGVGKTELALQTAALLNIGFKRFDMSEYMEKHAVARLIGAPPGYVGFDQGGLLTEAIRKNPHCVLLMDEIEKAHPDIFNILLQVMDHATLTDNTGRKTDFRNVILIMTSNAGAKEMDSLAIGFGNTHDDTGYKGAKAIKETFSPEFRNRLDAIVQFDPLTPEIMGLVVDKMLKEVQGQLAAKKIGLKIDKDARSWLAIHGYDSKYGARPLARLIQQTIKDQAAEALLSGRLQKGKGLTVKLKDNQIIVI